MVSHTVPSKRGCVTATTTQFRGIGGCRGNVGEPAVALFSSTFVNKVDRKGRVSVPASFRAELASQVVAGVVAFRSVKYPALDASGYDRLEDITQRLDELPEFSDERDALASVLADAQQMTFDSEGRITLPQALAEHAGITENVAFVGVGRTFQLWEPQRYQTHRDEMREMARLRNLTLPPRGNSK